MDYFFSPFSIVVSNARCECDLKKSNWYFKIHENAPTMAIWLILYQTSDAFSFTAKLRARSKHVTTMSYC